MGKYFGTDGFRGEAGITLTADHAYKVGRFLGWYYNALRERNGDTDSARIVIGKDTRRSSYINANKDTFKMYTDMFLTEYIILAIHLNSQGALSDVVLNKVKKNANLMI